MKASTTHPMRALVGATLATVLLVQPATAQDSEPVLEEIIVTAAYREQGLMDVPVSVSAVTGEMILDTGIQKADQVRPITKTSGVMKRST